MPRPQFTLKTMLWLMLVVAFLGGVIFERERHRDKLPSMSPELREEMKRAAAAGIY